MENKINIAELLEDCPMGMELDSPLFDNLYFDCIDAGKKYCVKCYIRKGVKTSVIFNCYGQFTNDSKCMIFPKGKTTWEGFVPPCKFKDGDVVYTSLGNIALLTDKQIDECFSICCILIDDTFEITESFVRPLRFATEEEKAKLFQAIKDNGYKWNAETKTLEKLIKPKFKEGDTIKNKKTYIRGTITKIHKDCYECDNRYILTFENQDNWELIEPKFKVGDRIKKNKDHISGIITNISDDGSYKVEYQGGGVSYVYPAYQDEWELVPNKFDISTLVPFESRVLVRNKYNDFWEPAIFGVFYAKEHALKFCIVGSRRFEECVPYEGNEHLRGTTDDCDEYFKIWK